MRTLMTAAALFMLPAAGPAQEPDYDAVAHTIVTQSAEVQPGEVVVIRGSVGAMPHVAEGRLHPHIEGLTLTANGEPVVTDGVVTAE